MGRTHEGHDKLTHNEWLAEGESLFGADTKMREWKFVCPTCGHVASGQDFIDLFEAKGMTADEANKQGARVAGRECIGRHTLDAGCDWCAWGLFRGPREVTMKRPDPTVDGSLPDEMVAEPSIWCFRFARP